MIGSEASAVRPKRTEDAQVKARAPRIVPLGLASPRATPKSVFALLPSPSMPPSSSTQVDDRDHAERLRRRLPAITVEAADLPEDVLALLGFTRCAAGSMTSRGHAGGMAPADQPPVLRGGRGACPDGVSDVVGTCLSLRGMV